MANAIGMADGNYSAFLNGRKGIGALSYLSTPEAY